MLGQPESLLGRAEFERLTESFQRLWSRGYATTSCVVVKATSSAGTSRLLRCSIKASDARAIYLNVAAEPYLATLLAGQNSPLDLRGHAAERMRRLRARVRAPLRPAPRPVAGRARGDELARRIADAARGARAAPGAHPAAWISTGSSRTCRAALQRVLTHLRLPDDRAHRGSAIARSPVLTRYSKAPEHPYGPRAAGDHPGRGAARTPRGARARDALARGDRAGPKPRPPAVLVLKSSTTSASGSA